MLADGELTAAEENLRQTTATGALVDLRKGDPAVDDPRHGERWGSERAVRAEVLAELLTQMTGSQRPRRALRLAGARITGMLDLEAAELLCPVLLQGCWFEQPVNLAEARVPALRLRGCHLPVLTAGQLETRGSLELNQGFTTHQGVDLLGAHIGAQLDLSGATLTNPGGLTLDLARLRVTTLFLRWLPEPPEWVNLIHAQVDVLTDDPASWPGQVNLRGFAYDALYEQPTVSARQRLGWLGRDPGGYTPQPYEQLAAVYRRAGREQDTRTVAIANQRVRRPTLPLPGRLWSLLLDALVGYGYRTWLARAWLLAWWVAGTLVSAAAHPRHLTLATPGQPHAAFQPAVYALDVLLPVVDLDQQAAWIPQGAARWFAWAAILAGWVLTTAVLAGLSGILKRD